ncbi:hypothetical protein ACFLS1_05250 [Verrucomicrobiota bacterium]
MMRHTVLPVAVLFLSVAITHAAIIRSDTWDADDEGWTSTDYFGDAPWGTTSWSGNLGGEEALETTRSSGGGLERDFIYATDNVAGNLDFGSVDGSSVESVSFDFYADAGGAVNYPAGLSLFFMSDAGGSETIWYYTFDVTEITAGWNDEYQDFEFGANMTLGAGWWSETGSDFAGDLADVDEIGILLEYQPGYDSQVYGIDNFALNDIQLWYIPEPETYVVLAFTLLSLGFIFRRRLVSEFALQRKFL